MSSPEVKITKLQARAVNAPLAIPIQTAVGTVSTAPLVLIDIYTNAGVTGHSWIFSYTPLCLKPLQFLVKSLSAFTDNKDLSPVAVSNNIENSFLLLGNTGLLRMASAGIDMAIWDALAKVNNQPLFRILGGEATAIRTYDSHSMDGKHLATERAVKSYEEGYRALKTKIGYKTLEEDLEVISAIRSATNNEMTIMVDYNQSQSVPEAIRRIKSLESEAVYWVEEPTKQFDYEGHAKINASSRLPVQMGENWLGHREMSLCLESKACDLAMADIMKIGGVTGWLKASALAERHNIPLSSHLFQEFSAHMLSVTANADWLERMDIASSILDSSIILDNGYAKPSEEIGAGFSWKESEIQKYLV